MPPNPTIHEQHEDRLKGDATAKKSSLSGIDAANEKHPMHSKKNSISMMRRSHVEIKKDPVAEEEKSATYSPPHSPMLVPSASSGTVKKYKTMMRTRMSLPAGKLDEDMGRSQDFYGQSEVLQLERKTQASLGSASASPRHSPKSRNSKSVQHRWGKPDPQSDAQARPTEWLGSPAGRRKSYKIKETASPALLSEIPLPEDEVSTPKLTKPTFDTFSAPSSVPTASRRAAFKNPAGDYSHIASVSDSRLLSPGKSGTVDEIEKYKAKIRSRNFSPKEVYEDIGRSQQFLGQSEILEEKLDRKSSPKTSPKVGRTHMWGSPNLDDVTQARPAEWLGSPSSERRKSYKIKNIPIADIVPPTLTSPLTSPKTVVCHQPSPREVKNGTPPCTPVAFKEKIGGKRFSLLHQVFESPK